LWPRAVIGWQSPALSALLYRLGGNTGW